MTLPSRAVVAGRRGLLLSRWPRIFGALDATLVVADEVLGQPVNEVTYHRIALLAHLARGLDAGLAIRDLAELGNGAIGLMACRLLGDLFLSAAYLAEDEERAELFAGWAQIEAAEMHKLATEVGWPNVAARAAALVDEERLPELRQRYRENIRGWTQTKTKDLAARATAWETDEGHRVVLGHLLRMMHVIGDAHSHAGTLETAQYIRLDEASSTLVIQMQRSADDIPQALMIGAIFLGYLVDVVATSLGHADQPRWRMRTKAAFLQCMDIPKDAQPRRNDPCPCRSGLKFKNCHGGLRDTPASRP